MSPLSGREAILDILSRAADDQKFLARLAENPHKVIAEYNLTMEERIALARGDIIKVESWIGHLDRRLSTWFRVRSTRERW
jgi:hypothetical protein